MDPTFIKISLVLNVWRCTHGSTVAMLQHATSSQSIVFNPIQAPATTTVSTHSVVDDFSKTQAKYEFKYEVADHQTGDRKTHWESRDGDTVRGVYTLYEPDGALRTVEYTADALHGFNAVVKRTMASKQKRPKLSSTQDALFPRSLTSNLGYLEENKGLLKTENIINKGYLRQEAVYNPGVNFSVDHGKVKPKDTPFAF